MKFLGSMILLYVGLLLIFHPGNPVREILDLLDVWSFIATAIVFSIIYQIVKQPTDEDTRSSRPN